MNMIFIYLIIFIISIDDILTTNLSKNSSSNRIIILASCQADKTGLESIPIPSDRHYYFYFSSQPSLSLSSSSSFLPLFHLSYCEHQHTTYYSSSGFSILRSSPRLPLTDILDKKNSSSFDHHNAILSVVNQSSSTSRNMITTLMSSTITSSKEKHVLVDADDNLISPTINSFPTTTTPFSNISLFHTSLSTTQKGNQTFNIMLLTGCMTAGLIILIIICTIIKYCNRDEGSYKIDESKTFTTKSHLDNPNHSGCTGKISAPKHHHHHHHQKLLTKTENITNAKEWYV